MLKISGSGNIMKIIDDLITGIYPNGYYKLSTDF